MWSLVRAACLGAIWLVPALSAAQDLTPRAYLPLPVSSNAIGLTYAFSRGDILFDPTVPITDVTGTIHSPVASYYHAFDFFGRSANVTGVFPFAVGDIRGNLGGEGATAHRAGMADAVLRFAVNLRGGKALTLGEFVKAVPARSVWGTSIKVVAPTGQYDPPRLINIGSNRWAVKPELGYSGRVGPLLLDVYTGVWFFTVNDEYFVLDPNAPPNRRSQSPIGAFELHVSYDVKPRLWISADVNYWRGGRTSVNSVESTGSLQANSRVGLTGSVPISRRQSIKVSYSDGLVVRFGGRFRILSLGWQYAWVGQPRPSN